jgi:phytanoyl-CoA hydroxylase
MHWASRTINGVLAAFDLRLSRASSFNRLIAQVERLHQTPAGSRPDGENAQADLLQLSQTRWRADEPDDGLTWGVPMSGQEFVRVLFEHFNFENQTIVEVGPGYGRILDALLKRAAPFRRYIGLEISAARVARLAAEFRDPRVEFRQADILSGVDLKATADLAFSSAVFEHLYPDFGKAVQTIADFLRPGGIAVIDFIRDDRDVEKSAAWFDKETYMRTYSSKELYELFASHGFTIKQSQRISFGLDILNREITRTVIVAAKPQPVLRPPISDNAVNDREFEKLVHRAVPPCDPHTIEPPVVPQFRSKFGGFWTDLNTADTLLAGKLATGEISEAEANLIEAWRRDGFAVLPGAVDETAIDAALADFERTLDGGLQRYMSFWDDDGHHISQASRELVHKKDAKLLDLYDISSATQAIQFAPAISRFFHIVFERPALAFQSLGFYYGSRQPLHQDTAFVRVNSPMEFVASWIALEDIQEGSGELEYYVGSHALPQYLFGGKHLWVQPGDPEVEQFSNRLIESAQRAGLRKQRFLAKKGDVLIWAAGLMHGGSPVQPPMRTRKSLVTHYCPADLQPMYAYKGGRPKRKTVGGNYIIAEQWV